MILDSFYDYSLRNFKDQPIINISTMQETDHNESSTTKPKSIRQIREMRKREPKLVEGPKNTLILRGNKTSNLTTQFLSTIRQLKKEHSTFYSRRHDTHPFESTQVLQKYCRSTDSSLFMFGSNSKKRPNNLVIGRMYEWELLDMVEFGIDGEGTDEVCELPNIPTNCRPFLVFQGDKWETDETYAKVRNLLQDFFVENISVSEIEINTMRLVLTFSAANGKIYLRTFEVTISGEDILEDEGNIEVAEVAPKVDLTLRRSQFADADLWKQAVKQPKPATKKHEKNISRDNIGDKRGKVYVDTQNFDALPLKKRNRKLEKQKRKEQQKQARLQEFQA